MASSGAFGIGVPGAGGPIQGASGPGLRHGLGRRHHVSNRGGQTSKGRQGWGSGRRSGEHARAPVQPVMAFPPGVTAMGFCPSAAPGPMGPTPHVFFHPVAVHVAPALVVQHVAHPPFTAGQPVAFGHAHPARGDLLVPHALPGPGEAPMLPTPPFAAFHHGWASPGWGREIASPSAPPARPRRNTRASASGVALPRIGVSDPPPPSSSNPDHYFPNGVLITKSRLRRVLVDDIKAEVIRRGVKVPEEAELWRKDRWVEVLLEVAYGGRYEEQAQQWRTDQKEEEEVQRRNSITSNAKGLQLFFMGTSLGASDARGQPCTALRLSRQTLLFGVGEDTQRRFADSLITPYRVSRIFIPSRNPVFYLGLPGIVCTISGTRSGGMSTVPLESDGRTPLRIYAPPGVAEYLHTTLDVSNTYVCIPVVVYELVDGPVSREERRPQLVNPRCRLFRAKLPSLPYRDEASDMTEEEEDEYLQSIAYTQQLRDSVIRNDKGPLYGDRAIFRPFKEVGSEVEQGCSGLGLDAATLPAMGLWSIGVDAQWQVVVSRPRDQAGGFSFLLREANRAGKVDAFKCREMGLTPSAQLAKLKSGESVMSPSGVLIHPEDVVSPDWPGRKIVVALDRPDHTTLAPLAHKASLVVHTSSVVRPAEAFVTSGTVAEDRGMCEEAGRFCERVGARMLALTNFRVPLASTDGGEGQHLEELKRAAESRFGGDVLLPQEFELYDVDFEKPGMSSRDEAEERETVA